MIHKLWKCISQKGRRKWLENRFGSTALVDTDKGKHPRAESFLHWASWLSVIFVYTVFRLPPYHPDLNPIEKIWSIIKGYVGSKNVDMTLESVQTLVEEKVSGITTEVWGNTCRHVINTEKEYTNIANTMDEIIDNSDLVFQVNENSETSSENYSSEYFFLFICIWWYHKYLILSYILMLISSCHVNIFIFYVLYFFNNK